MKQETQIRLAESLLAHIAAKSTDVADSITQIPVSAYTCADRLAKEQQVLFRDAPQFVGLSCSLKAPGDYFTDDYSGVPLLLVRDKAGKFRAFINACRHRGSRVAEDSGNAGSAFVCPYHGWSYQTTGELNGIPYQQYFDDVDRTQCNLVELASTEVGGMLFVNPGSRTDAGPVKFNAPLSEEIGSYKLESYFHYEQREMSLEFNWKLAMDTFLEPYHFPVLHKNTVGPIFYPNLCSFEAFGEHLREVFPRRTIGEIQDKPQKDWDLITHSAIVYILFPNTALIMQIDHAEVWRMFPHPTDPAKCTVLLDFYIPEPATTDKARTHWDKNMDLTVRTVLAEDFPVNAGAQKGFTTNAQNHITFGRNEPALAHFETTVAQALKNRGQVLQNRT